jgi:integrase
MIVVLWRAGLRMQEALALTDHDLDQPRGSILVRSGKVGGGARSGRTSGAGSRPGSRRAPNCRSVAVLRDRRPHAWPAVVGRSRPPRIPSAGRRGRDLAQVRTHQLRHAHALELAREGVR